MKRYHVYILASEKYGTLYVGVTSNLPMRIKAHKEHTVKGFTDKYNVTKLVYVEVCETARQAIELEKKLKKWNRAWKIRIIESINPNWEDLSGKDGFFL
jgi:putative endonuclease